MVGTGNIDKLTEIWVVFDLSSMQGTNVKKGVFDNLKNKKDVFACVLRIQSYVEQFQQNVVPTSRYSK